MHVDDFLWAGSNKFQKDIISRIRSIFEVGKEATIPFKYIGLNPSQEEMCIMAIPQNRVVKNMLASETLALSEGIDNAFNISMF